MTYKEIVEQLFKAYPMYHRTGASAYKEGLENIEALLSVTGNPERKLNAIHVAGTNGKGSVAHLLASYCMERGYKTGLFTSPHLVDFRERVRIDGQMIAEEEVLDFFRRYQRDFVRVGPSFFEMTTALAFSHFALHHVDIAVVETGLGGRLDATNVLRPLLSVITNISLEHTQLLGGTVAKIAFEKAGIIKENTPIVVGEFHPESYPVFKDVADRRQAPLFLAEGSFRVTGPLSDCTIADAGGNVLYDHVCLPVRGEYQRKNVVTFLQAAEVFEQLRPFNSDAVLPALENVVADTGLAGRWQVLGRQPFIICDVGHNAGGLSLTMPSLSAMPCRQLRMVFGMVKDKDMEAVMSLLPANAVYYLCQADIERAVPAGVLAEAFAGRGLHCRTFGAVGSAFCAARADAAPDDIVFVGGSCFVVGDLLRGAGGAR